MGFRVVLKGLGLGVFTVVTVHSVGNLEQSFCGTVLAILVKSKIASILGHLAILVTLVILPHLLVDEFKFQSKIGQACWQSCPPPQVGHVGQDCFGKLAQTIVLNSRHTVTVVIVVTVLMIQCGGGGGRAGGGGGGRGLLVYCG